MDKVKNYYAIIPANVRYDKRLSAGAKLLYGEITALSSATGVCYASNSYFMQLYAVSDKTVQKWIKALEECGYVDRDIKYEKNSIVKRSLTIVNQDFGGGRKVREGGEEKFVPPPKKSSGIIIQSNNTRDNNISPLPSSKKSSLENLLLGCDTLSDNAKTKVAKWLEYKKYNIEEVSLQSLITVVNKNIDKHGEQAVGDLIEESISNTYKGIIWDKLDKGSPLSAPRQKLANEKTASQKMSEYADIFASSSFDF